MTDKDTRALLAEALEFFNDHPRFSLRRDRRRTSYDLASRIETHLATWNKPPHPAIAIARERWDTAGVFRVDEDERCVALGSEGYWVRAWICVGSSSVGEIDEAMAARYRQALAGLSASSRAILAAHQHGDLDYRQIAERFGITVEDVEREIADALFVLASALGSER